jgi:GDP-L-fucose synthase
MKEDSKIFVAGHRGLVGSALVRALTLAGYKNIVTATKDELDLRNQEDVFDWFYKTKPEYVFLAAAKVGGINYNANYPADFITDNLLIQCNVIRSSYMIGVNKLLFLGSACIYPKVTPQPIKEEYLLTAPLEPTNEPYAIAKIAGLRMCQAYHKQHGFNAISVMPANLYGINDNFHSNKCHVIPGLINKFYTAKINNDSIVEAWGDGTPTREFLYVDDLADACIFLMNNYDNPDHINIGSDTEIEIKTLADIIKRKVGYQGDIFWNINKPNGTPRRKIDNSKLFSMGWKPKVTFEDGLQRTVDWFIQNKDRFS